MWRSRRAQGVGSGEGVHHLIRAVSRRCTRLLPACCFVAADTVCRCCSYSTSFFQSNRTEPKRPFHFVEAPPVERDQRSGALPRPSSISAPEVNTGIIAEWVPDVLGYHMPLGLRERSEPAPRPSLAEAADLKALTNAETRGTEHQELQKVSSATRDTCESSQVGGGGGGHRDGHSGGPSFCGPLPNFATSPVFEWRGYLWQWRPVKVTSVAGAGHPKTSTVSAPLCHWERSPSQDKALCSAVKENDLAEGVLGESSQDYYLVPFLLSPTLEVRAVQPFMHDSLRRELAAAQSACHHQRRRGSEGAKQYRSGTRCCPTYRECKPQLWSIRMPTPVGELAIVSSKNSESDAVIKQSTKFELPTFSMIEGELPMRVGERTRDWFDPETTHPTPPEAETWEAATATVRDAQGASTESDTVPYVHVFCSEMSTVCCDSPLLQTGNKVLASPTPSPRDLSRPTLPIVRRNVVGGGLAELFLAVDRYAALIARSDLTLSAACWATLCDTKSCWVVQRLRVCPLEMERELVAATEAHKRWQQYAISRNRTLVGKSSHGICFYDYPSLAKWPRS
ncbi:hypothetical protein Q4I28_007035 [Leishmania naiffi]|uniref:Uncharacterized protein n=1 Tax=Leishmania naiffi TaxID=5678 RepID=A0AAW3BB61_9TRYP